jgi:hypothetical protein
VAYVASARLAGIGNVAARRFCTFMNLNKPPSEFVQIQNILHEGFRQRAQISVKRAIEECQQQHVASGGNGEEMRASLDGTWMKRGRTSKTGMVAAIGPNNKVVGLEVLHKYCPMCKGKQPCKLGAECGINYQGSSGGMEPVAAATVIKRIHEETGVKVTEYLSDGDSRGFSKAQSEVDWKIEKLECVNHVAKRMGTRLRKRKLEKKNVELPNGRKGLGGRGLLTSEKIDKIQRYYNWIKSNPGNVQQMQRYIMAMYKHIASTDAHPDHDDCNPQVCKFKLAVAKGEPYSHKDRRHFHVIPDVMMHTKNIFEDLAKTELLKKCAHGMTQNANECFNSTVWNLLSKNGFANRKLV